MKNSLINSKVESWKPLASADTRWRHFDTLSAGQRNFHLLNCCLKGKLDSESTLLQISQTLATFAETIISVCLCKT